MKLAVTFLFFSQLEAKIAMKNAIIADRDEDNAIAIPQKFVSVRDDFSYETTFIAIRDENEFVANS